MLKWLTLSSSTLYGMHLRSGERQDWLNILFSRTCTSPCPDWPGLASILIKDQSAMFRQSDTCTAPQAPRPHALSNSGSCSLGTKRKKTYWKREGLPERPIRTACLRFYCKTFCYVVRANECNPGVWGTWRWPFRFRSIFKSAPVNKSLLEACLQAPGIMWRVLIVAGPCMIMIHTAPLSVPAQISNKGEMTWHTDRSLWISMHLYIHYMTLEPE